MMDEFISHRESSLCRQESLRWCMDLSAKRPLWVSGLCKHTYLDLANTSSLRFLKRQYSLKAGQICYWQPRRFAVFFEFSCSMSSWIGCEKAKDWRLPWNMRLTSLHLGALSRSEELDWLAKSRPLSNQVPHSLGNVVWKMPPELHAPARTW